MRRNQNITEKVLSMLEKDPGKNVKDMAQRLKVNRTFLAGYLEALENEGCLKSKKIGPAKVYFKERSE